MGDTDYNLTARSHRFRPYSAENDWAWNCHHANYSIDSNSPGLAVGDMRAMIGVAKDGTKTQADFDAVAGAVSGGFGSWYTALATAAKQCCRDNCKHWT